MGHMSRLGQRLDKLESKSPSNYPVCRWVIFDDTRENVERQVAEEGAAAEAAGESLIARIIVPHKGESMNESRKASGMVPLDTPGWDEPRQ